MQIAPEIAPGSGVAGVASALEREFAAKGVRVERFTLEEARGGRRTKPVPRTALGRRLSAAWSVVWFSTVGTTRAREFLSARPDAVSICHNDVMAGDIYVNHGLLQPAMRARGHYGWRMLRNPVHLYTVVRDRRRYRRRTHRAVVALTRAEADLLRETYGKVARADLGDPERGGPRAVPAADGCGAARGSSGTRSAVEGDGRRLRGP